MTEQIQNELIEVEASTALEAFTSGDELDKYIDDVRLIISGFEHDLTTATGRKKTASLAHKVSKLKTRLDGMGKDLVTEWKGKAKKVDQNRKSMRDQLDDLRDEARAPLTEWEDAETARVDHLKMRVDDLSYLVVIDNLDDMKARLGDLQLIVVDQSFQEFEADAHRTKNASIEFLESAIDAETKRIAQQEELERLRTEKTERDKVEYEERIKREAANSARLKAEAEAMEIASKIEGEKQEAIQKQKLAEKALSAIEAEKQVQADEQAKLETNKQHVGKIRKAAKTDLMKFVDEDVARKIVLAIHVGEISNINIQY